MTRLNAPPYKVQAFMNSVNDSHNHFERRYIFYRGMILQKVELHLRGGYILYYRYNPFHDEYTGVISDDRPLYKAVPQEEFERYVSDPMELIWIATNHSKLKSVTLEKCEELFRLCNRNKNWLGKIFGHYQMSSESPYKWFHLDSEMHLYQLLVKYDITIEEVISKLINMKDDGRHEHMSHCGNCNPLKVGDTVNYQGNNCRVIGIVDPNDVVLHNASNYIKRQDEWSWIPDTILINDHGQRSLVFSGYCDFLYSA